MSLTHLCVFKDAPLSVQENIVWEFGSFLGIVDMDGDSVGLYQVADYFVEVWFATFPSEIRKIQVPASTELIKKHVDLAQNLKVGSKTYC